jgi:hypothetical protein
MTLHEAVQTIWDAAVRSFPFFCAVFTVSFVRGWRKANRARREAQKAKEVQP